MTCETDPPCYRICFVCNTDHPFRPDGCGPWCLDPYKKDTLL